MPFFGPIVSKIPLNGMAGLENAIFSIRDLENANYWYGGKKFEKIHKTPLHNGHCHT